MQIEKYHKIFNNFINGNLTEFREQIKKLSKKELLEFCIETSYHYCERKDILQFLNTVKKHLTIN